MTILYRRWLEIADRAPAALALLDLTARRTWTFRDLVAETSSATLSEPGFVFPRGQTAQFIFAVLRGWRAGAVVCPLEPEQAPPTVPVPPPGIAHLKLTSATTGPARCVAFTAEQLAADSDNLVQTMGLRPDWPNLGVISLAHSYGFSSLVTPLLLHGIPLILPGSPLPEAVQRAAKLCPTVTLPGVPALWSAWHEADAIPPNVALAISAGAPLPLRLEHAASARRGLKLHNFYGSTECGGIAYDATSEPRHDAAVVGTAVRNVGLSVAADGCLEVRSAAVGSGYWPEASPALAHGCFHTSDLAALRDGRVWLRGRLSDVINVAGRKVSPETIEAALAAHPAVRECVVFGVPAAEAERGEDIVAVVVLRETTPLPALREFLDGRLPAWGVPRLWKVVATLPSTDRGKRSRAEMRRALWG